MIKVNIPNYRSNLSPKQVVDNKGIYAIGEYNSARFVNNGDFIFEFNKSGYEILVHPHDEFISGYEGTEFIKLNEIIEINFVKDSNET